MADIGSTLSKYTGASELSNLLESDKFGKVSVKTFGAVGDGVTDDTDAIEAALAASSSIWFPSGTYLVSSTIRCSDAVFIDGEKDAIVIASSGFTGILVTENSVAISLKAIFAIFKGTTISDTGGSLISSGDEPSCYIGKITLDCSSNCDYGVFIERAPYSIIKCDVYDALADGIRMNVYCWGSHFNANKIQGCVASGIYMLAGNNGIHIDNITVYGNPTRTVYGIVSSGNNNGVAITGGFLERLNYGLYLTGYSGPHAVRGVDIEDITYNSIKTDHDLSNGFIAGAIIVDGCLLYSSEESILNKYTLMEVSNCSFNDKSAIVKIVGTNSPVLLRNNIYGGNTTFLLSSVTNTPCISMHQDTINALNIVNSKHNKLVDYIAGYSLKNYLSENQPLILSSSIEFQSSYQGGATDLQTGKCIITVNQTNTAGGTDQVYATTGLEIHSIGTTIAVLPSGDNTHFLGVAGNRWKEIYCANSTINTSDAREKTQVLSLTENELNASIQLSKEIGTYKFLQSMIDKGDNARTHIGMTVQRAIEIMEQNNLNPYSYSFICYDEWEDEKDDNGNITRNSGSRYGFRLEQLLLFIAKGIDARLTQLESVM